MSLWESLVDRMGEYVPFTASNLVWRLLDNSSKSLLDAGCGPGKPGRIIKRHRNIFTVGADIFFPYLISGKERQIHDEYVLCDVRKLPFKENSFDVVLCKEVIEHLEKAEGEEVIREMEQIARRQVIITTPVGIWVQPEYDSNPFQEHLSAREPIEMETLGYTVRGVGIRGMHGEQGFQEHFPQFLGFLLDIMYVLAGPIVYFFPKWACFMVCIKRFN